MNTFKEYIEEAAMDARTALQIFGLSEFPKTAEELRRLHKQLAMQNHPDRGGSLDKMKDINAANDVLKQNIGRSIRSTFYAAGRSANPAQAYKKAGTVFSRKAKQAEQPESEDEKAAKLIRKKIFNLIMQKLSYIDTAGIKSRLDASMDDVFSTEILMPPKSAITDPWLTLNFRNSNKTVWLNVRLNGDTDHYAYRMRHTDTGVLTTDNFDFQWSLAIDLYYGRNRMTVMKTKKFRAADLDFLKNAGKFLTPAKMKKMAESVAVWKG